MTFIEIDDDLWIIISPLLPHKSPQQVVLVQMNVG